MNQLYKFLFLPLIALFIFGCAQAPLSTSFPMTTQQKIQSVSHWNIVAEDVAEQIRIGLTAINATSRPVYVEKKAYSPFNEGFNNMLLTKLIEKGVKTIAVKDNDALKIDYNSQVVYHKSPLKQPKTGKIVLLSGGVLAAREAFWHASTGGVIATIGGALTALALMDDAGQGLFDTYSPNTEIIFTTSVIDGNQYILRKTDCYYINFADSWHYNDDVQSKTIKVVN